jgi:chitinase
MARFAPLRAATCLAALTFVVVACGGSGISTPQSPSPAPVPPLHFAGTFYPLYNAGIKQWIEPTAAMPFERVGEIFAAFAHAYPQGKGATLAFEAGQRDQAQRLRTLVVTARKKNPHVRILISLGWGKRDWTYVSNDYVNQAGFFVPSVVRFVRENDLDGFDIDDEGIGGESGVITQPAFDAVASDLRRALDAAAAKDRKRYYLTITPAGNNDDTGGLRHTQVDAENAADFDWIGIQSYYDQAWGEEFEAELRSAGYPPQRIVPGINTEDCAPVFPEYAGLGGLFNWTMSADSACHFKYTRQIARDVGY